MTLFNLRRGKLKLDCMYFLIKKIRIFIIRNFIIKGFSPFFVVFSLYVYPPLVNSFVSFIKLIFRHELGLLGLNNRLKKTNNPIDDFDIKKNDLKKEDEINIILRGSSLKKYFNEIDFNFKTFYVNFYGDKFVDCEKITIQDNIVYTTGDNAAYKKITSEGLFPVYNFSQNSTHKSKVKSFSLGSGLVVITALSGTAKKINVYGWDCYFKENLSDMSYFKCLRAIASPAERGKGGTLLKGDGTSLIPIKNNCYSKVIPFVFQKIVNIHYASRFIATGRFNIRSNLSGVSSQNKILESIDILFYDV